MNSDWIPEEINGKCKRRFLHDMPEARRFEVPRLKQHLQMAIHDQAVFNEENPYDKVSLIELMAQGIDDCCFIPFNVPKQQ